MNLHRTTGKPDWETIPAPKRSTVQNVAVATHGIVTPPNLITFVGLGLVLYGLYALLQQDYWLGLALLAIGRLLDIADGLVAQKTGTKSPLGELLDAAVDKIGTLLTIVILFVGGISYWWLIALLLLPQIIIPIVSLYKKSKNKVIHPTRIGKLSMASLWVSIVGLIVIKALAIAWFHPLSLFVYLVSIVAIKLGLIALWQYSTGRD